MSESFNPLIANLQTDSDDDQNAKNIRNSCGVADLDRMFNWREECDHNPADKIKKLKLDNPYNPILAHLNINSIRYKHADLFTLIDSNIDVLVIGETKLDSSFPNSQLEVDGYKSPFRKDRNSNGGGLLIPGGALHN